MFVVVFFNFRKNQQKKTAFLIDFSRLSRR